MKPHLTEKPLISEKIYINLLGPTTSLMRGFSVNVLIHNKFNLFIQFNLNNVQGGDYFLIRFLPNFILLVLMKITFHKYLEYNRTELSEGQNREPEPKTKNTCDKT